MPCTPRSRNATIYRACACGETAHDYKYQLAAEYGGAPGTGRYVWGCRNCGTLARDRKGEIKANVRASRSGGPADGDGVGGDDPQTDKGG